MQGSNKSVLGETFKKFVVPVKKQHLNIRFIVGSIIVLVIASFVFIDREAFMTHQKTILQFFKVKSKSRDTRTEAIVDEKSSSLMEDAKTSVCQVFHSALSLVFPEAEPNNSVSILTMGAHYIPSLRQLNAVLLPVYYSDRLYREVLASPRTCKIASYGTIPVGAITSRLENLEDSYLTEIADTSVTRSFLSATMVGELVPQEYHMYIMTLGVLPTYRRLGIGRQLVEALIAEASMINAEVQKNRKFHRNKGPFSKGTPGDALVTCITLHVQENNFSAMEFYERLGFTKLYFVKHYYTRIEPRGAFIMIFKLPFEPYIRDLIE